MKGRDILGGLPNRTKAATSAYRDGWSGVFGRTEAGERMRADLDEARRKAECHRRRQHDDETPEQHIARLRAMWP